MTTKSVRQEADSSFESLDFDRDGSIQRADFVAMAACMLESIGETPESRRGRAVVAGAEGLWQALLPTLDRDGDKQISRDELRTHRRFELLSIINDVLIGLWFVVGSVFFFWEPLTYDATWFFVIGSLQFLCRPVIHMCWYVHRKRNSFANDQPDM